MGVLPLAGFFLQLPLRCGHMVPSWPFPYSVLPLLPICSHQGGDNDSHVDLWRRPLSSPHFCPLEISTQMSPRNFKPCLCPMTKCPPPLPPYKAFSGTSDWVISPCKGSASPNSWPLSLTGIRMLPLPLLVNSYSSCKTHLISSSGKAFQSPHLPKLSWVPHSCAFWKSLSNASLFLL